VLRIFTFFSCLLLSRFTLLPDPRDRSEDSETYRYHENDRDPVRGRPTDDDISRFGHKVHLSSTSLV